MKKTKERRVSYIITTKNRAEFLELTLQNIREFITAEDELLILDGGSTDRTEKLVKKNRDIVSYFHSEPDYGEAHALNKGILASSGRIIKILTDDDYIYPKAMQKAIQVLERHPELDALQCGGEAYVFNEETQKMDLLFYEQVSPEIQIQHDVLHVTTYCPCGLGLVLTRKVIARAGLFDTTFRAVDLNYMSKLILCQANFKYLNISLYKHYNYAHSGENAVHDIHRDEARVYIDHGLWEQTLHVETPVLKEVLGLDKCAKGEELLRSIKLIDFLRRKHITIPIDILNMIALQKDVVQNLRARLRPRQQVEPTQAPRPPKRDGKFW